MVVFAALKFGFSEFSAALAVLCCAFERYERGGGVLLGSLVRYCGTVNLEAKSNFVDEELNKANRKSILSFCDVCRYDSIRSMRTRETKKRLWLAGLALILYVILSLIYFGATGNYGRMYLGYGGDPIVYIWCLNWWPWAIAHGLNPFFSYYVWFPHGFNMTWANSVASAALLMLPVTWLANSVVSFNVLSLLAPVLSAWMGFLLARNLTQDMLASFISGYLFGFSPNELGQMLGHLNLDLTFVVPLLVLLVVQRIRGDLSRLRFVAALAVALLVQLGLATEILATASVFGGITWGDFSRLCCTGGTPALLGGCVGDRLSCRNHGRSCRPVLIFRGEGHGG